MSHPGPDGTPAGEPRPYQSSGQPGQPGRPAWQPPPDGATSAGRPQRGGMLTKVLPVVGGVLLVAALASAFGLLGGAPEVGDCVREIAGGEVEVVDCAADEAEARIVGMDERELDFSEFMADPAVCADFPNATDALWVGGDEDEPGAVYCAEPL